MNMDNLKKDILKCVAKHDGQWSWYQLDRALSYDENLPIIHRLGEALRTLEQEGLICAEEIEGHTRYSLTKLGEQQVAQQEIIAA